ncbi:hydroxyethylthiazole kinase-like uncharacterized protein yjeF [Rubricella aquisinus]|uniref:ADP-dependent (S)-NAD(P)H-hydrate dehydratase n=1 Tax=Rubricella aquisinus TaxID=2028108 RepID=A0A840X1D3_9RHOB|nr:NAD(P)H-hydrate dehydratase [Rubricella aquisinus]MBB5515705.1 hydroxyethylthiazole kinase-like uncharacterized protein yjeF [Rubricella aquisinus]
MTTAARYIPSSTDIARLAKSGARHKYDYGHAVIVSGPPGQGGAARLAARGALRVGAGLVSVLCGADSVAEHAARLDAIMVKPFAGGEDIGRQLAGLNPSALCIGPNLGLTARAGDLLDATLSLPHPVCLDADAITLIAEREAPYAGPFPAQTIMTPHAGELRRLIPHRFDTTTNRETLARMAAERWGCVILFKGVETIIAHPDGRCLTVASTAFAHAAWLATAGSGDVLAGIITGLLARGCDAMEAGALGATLHLLCAAECGPGLIAEDLPEALPAVLRHLLSEPDDGPAPR